MIGALSQTPWPFLAAIGLAALLVGFSKTSFQGLGALAVAIVALGMPARESTAFVLLLLLVGDVIAVITYHRDVNWRVLAGLLPAVIPGLLLGAATLRVVDDHLMRRGLGVLLLALLALQWWQSRRRARPPEHWTFTLGAGIAAGFTTMTANAAAPVMAVYFLARRYDKARFISTNAWLFLIINLCKVPLTASLGLFTGQVLWQWVAFAPLVVVGTFVGRWAVRRVDQRQFEIVVTLASVVASVLLLVR